MSCWERGKRVCVLVVLAQGLTWGAWGRARLRRRLQEQRLGGDAHACVGALGNPSPMSCPEGLWKGLDQVGRLGRRQHLPTALPCPRAARQSVGPAPQHARPSGFVLPLLAGAGLDAAPGAEL